MDWVRGSGRKTVKTECKLEVRCGLGESCKFLHEEVMEGVRFWVQNLRRRHEEARRVGKAFAVGPS